MKPENINENNEEQVMGEIIKKKENITITNNKFLNEGDYVRILEDKPLFGKTYMGRFSRNVYKITRRTNGIEGLIFDSYRLDGLKKTYLYSQLQKVDNPTEEEKTSKQSAQTNLDYDMMVGKSSKHLSQEMGISLEESRKLIRKNVKKQSQSSDIVKQKIPEFKASEENHQEEEKEKPHEIRRSTRSNRFTGSYKNITKVVPH
jgi:flagellar biosynthesis GTPase FlhF